MNRKRVEKKPIIKLPSSNDVFSPDFESKMDPIFVKKTKTKDHWTRGASVKLNGQWT